MSFRVAAYVPAFLLSLLLSSVCFPQSEPPDQLPDHLVVEQVDVQVVNVEAVVTDGKDRVHGLTRDDFVLEVAGHEVPVTYFTEVRDGKAVPVADTAASDAPTRDLPPGAVGASSSSDDARVPNHYLVFVDESTVVPTDRRRTLKALRKQADLLDPGDTLAVVAFDGSRLHALAEPTADAERIERAFDDLDLRWDRGLGSLLRRSAVSTCRDLELVMLRQIGRTVDATGAAMHLMAPQFPQGRRILFWISGSWPMYGTVGSSRDGTCEPTFEGDGVPRTENIYYGMSEAGTSRRIEVDRLAGLANRASYSVYPIDAPGSQALLDSSADRDPQLGLNLASTSSPAFAGREVRRAGPTGEASRRTHLEYVGEPTEADVHATLHRLARKTGGRALINFERNRPLKEVREDTRSYYWLGFHLPDELRGDEENPVLDIDLKLRGRRGVDVRARQNTVSLTRERERDLEAEARLFVDDTTKPLGLGARSGLQVALSEPLRAGAGKQRVAARLAVPVEDFVWIPGEDGEGYLDLEVRFQTLDEYDRISEVAYQKYRVPGPAPVAGAIVPLQVELLLRSRQQTLAVTAVDPLSEVTYFEKVEYMP